MCIQYACFCTGGYIGNYVKALKNWFSYNNISITAKVKVKNRDDLTKFADERPPTPDELRKIISVADSRAKAASALVAFSGVRLEVLGNYLGEDGLKVKDFPEMRIKGNTVDFERAPTKNLSEKCLTSQYAYSS